MHLNPARITNPVRMVVAEPRFRLRRSNQTVIYTGGRAAEYLPMTSPDFHGLRVLSLESRRAAEMAKLIANLGGQPVSAPALREVTLENRNEVREFLGRLCRGELDWMVFLTGIGLRRTIELADPEYAPAQLADALRRIRVVARGPKAAAELMKLGLNLT